MNLGKSKSISIACMATEKIFEKLLENFNDFSTEKGVSGFIAHEVKECGLKPAFKTIIGSVPGGCEPHHIPSLPLLKGFCVIDFGVKFNGYCSDFTRTVFLGKASKHEKALYNFVLKAQAESLKQIKAGVPAIKPYLTARKCLGIYAKNFVHGLGHGVGKRIHIKPFMKKKSRDVLKEGDVITVEPGIYFKKKFGIRVEDMLVVTKTGAKPITSFSRKLIEIPFKQ